MAMRPPGQPLLSPDGRYFWDGAEWRPASELAPVVETPQYQPVQPQPVQPQYYAPQAYYPVAAQPMYAQPIGVRPSNGVGTAAGVLGILAAILMFVPVADYAAIVLGVLAVIFGGVGISRANRTGVGKGMAVTGLVLGLIAIIVSLIFIIAIYAYLRSVTVTG